MKHLLLIIILVSSSFLSISQEIVTSRKMIPISYPSNVERYGIDYEIKDYTFNISDSATINAIDLNSIEHLRSQTENVEVFDANSGYTIILFYEKREKGNNQLNQKL